MQIKDFKLANSFLKAIANKNKKLFENIDFSEMDIFFDEKNKQSNEAWLVINDSKNIAHTNFKIISEYIDVCDKYNANIFKNEKIKKFILISYANCLRVMFFNGNRLDNYLEDEITVQYLYQRPLMWTLVKNLFCPIYDLDYEKYNNIKIMIGSNCNVDIARYYKKENFIFVNEINNQVCENAFLMVEILKMMGLKPIKVINDIIDNDLYDKFYTPLKIAFDLNKNVYDFILILSCILGYDFINKINKKNKISSSNIKCAQAFPSEIPYQWWYLGIIDRMMEPSRKVNYDFELELEKDVENFWNKVEKWREKYNNKKGTARSVPFNILLKLYNNEYDLNNSTDVTIQSLLSSERIW